MGGTDRPPGAHVFVRRKFAPRGRIRLLLRLRAYHVVASVRARSHDTPPTATVSTAAARAALPDSVAHADAVFSAGRATLLGAALASGSTELFAAALDDRLHEPYRAAGAPLLGEIKQSLPAGALGATLSGSGPTVIVWAADDGADACAAQLAERFPDERILRLESTTVGASTYSP